MSIPNEPQYPWEMAAQIRRERELADQAAADMHGQQPVAFSDDELTKLTALRADNFGIDLTPHGTAGMSELMIDPRYVAFVRQLIEDGKLNENAEGYVPGSISGDAKRQVQSVVPEVTAESLLEKRLSFVRWLQEHGRNQGGNNKSA